jgi:phosphoribosylformylglycinamidine synthase subunit PurS
VTFEAFVEVRKHPGIADPEGATIERALPTLGFAGVSGVSVGEAFRLTIEADDEAAARARVEALAERLLANPVLEEVRVSVTAGEGARA